LWLFITCCLVWKQETNRIHDLVLLKEGFNFKVILSPSCSEQSSSFPLPPGNIQMPYQALWSSVILPLPPSLLCLLLAQAFSALKNQVQSQECTRKWWNQALLKFLPPQPEKFNDINFQVSGFRSHITLPERLPGLNCGLPGRTGYSPLSSIGLYHSEYLIALSYTYCLEPLPDHEL
jgi:hypothetical protein